MIMNSRILAVALIAALVGGSLGAIAMRSSESSRQSVPVAATTNTLDTANPVVTGDATRDAKYSEATYNATTTQPVPNEFKTTEEQDAYKIGFADGFQAASERRNVGVTRSGMVSNYSSNSRSRRVYYDYGRKNGRTFWQKHRDKLTMAMGAGG